MIEWIRTEAAALVLAALSIFLLLSMGVIIFETGGLISDVKSVLTADFEAPAVTDASEAGEDAPSAKEGRSALKKSLEKRLNRFITTVLLLFLGVTIMTLLLSLKYYSKNDDPLPDLTLDEEEDMLVRIEEMDERVPEDSESVSAEYRKIFEALNREESLDDAPADEPAPPAASDGQEICFDPEVAGPLTDAYTRMMEALQKVNELEKKHSVELADANKLLENEISERERAEKEIRYLSRKLISGIEEAQKKLAQDLHDEFGQTLAALHMEIEALWNAIPGELSGEKDRFNNLIELIEQLGDKIRSISSDLRPDLLDDLGLIPTLEWYIKEFREQTGKIEVDFLAVGFKKRLSAEFELILYRIFQESLNNVVKHAKAGSVDVKLTYSYPKVIFIVKDDGVGFDTSVRTGGIGLIGMRERVDSVSGKIEIRSEPGKGSTIRVELPVNEQ